MKEKKKLPADDPAMLLLGEIQNRGIATDVIESNNVLADIPLIRLDDPSLDQSRTDVFNPMVGGISCGPGVSVLYAPWAGTLGIAATRTNFDNFGEPGIMSNQHVMYYDPETTTVYQPARKDSVWNYQAGDKLKAFKGNVLFGGVQIYVDCAVASVIADRSSARWSVFGIDGLVMGIVERSNVGLGNPVIKSGIATGVTNGKVKYLSYEAPDSGGVIAYNQFGIVGDDGVKFADGGDSGSVVLIGSKIMGLLWGGGPDNTDYLVAASPIEAVIQTLNVNLA
ncbi:hypothetical protein [Granulicella arctica]|uniref:Nal1 C-terminal domain-containing protein n=1 Tax=Granulicella arctica TaxID=940613 RepID=A0A7Y9PF68_9BACT|nr:hypothetical protein [Granulicella arctica]NYF78554.1 hypothetical protein [Granulicella arctica]